MSKCVTENATCLNTQKDVFLYAGNNRIADYDGDGKLLRRYVHGPSVDEPVAVFDYVGTPANPALKYYHADQIGTIVALSGANGAKTDTYTYSSWGEVGEESVAGNPFRFTGRELDAETGLYYYRARYYNAQHGRFLQVDPIGYKDHMNLYQYALWNPLSLIDPTGEEVLAQLRGRTIGDLAGASYKHSFLHITDTDSGFQFTVSGWVGGDYAGDVSDVLFGRDVGADLVANFASMGDTPDGLAVKDGSAEALGEAVSVGDSLDPVFDDVRDFVNEVNQSRTPYRGGSTNSNAFAFTLMHRLTGQRPPARLQYPGSGTVVPQPRVQAPQTSTSTTGTQSSMDRWSKWDARQADRVCSRPEVSC